jgi:hypothetical protein
MSYCDGCAKLLTENTALKARLAEAEAWWQGKVEEQRQGKYAAERERDEADARWSEEKRRRQVAEADLRKTEEHRLAAVAESVRYERKCAELSEALRFYMWDTMAVGFSETTVRKCCETKPKEDHESDCRAMLALASQPAPEESK